MDCICGQRSRRRIHWSWVSLPTRELSARWLRCRVGTHFPLKSNLTKCCWRDIVPPRALQRPQEIFKVCKKTQEFTTAGRRCCYFILWSHTGIWGDNFASSKNLLGVRSDKLLWKPQQFKPQLLPKLNYRKKILLKLTSKSSLNLGK